MLATSLLLLAIATSHASSSPLPVSLHPLNRSSYQIGARASVGIEFLNHEVYGTGAVYAQMVHGESFEEGEATAPSPVQDMVSFSSPDGSLWMRHCDYQLWETKKGVGPQDDYKFTLQPALSGTKGAITFYSVNFPTYVLSPITTDSIPGRLGLVEASAVKSPAAASFFQTAGKSFVSFTQEANSSLSIIRTGKHEGQCAGEFGSGSDAVGVGAGGGGNDEWVQVSDVPHPSATTGFIGCGPRAASDGSPLRGVSEMWKAVQEGGVEGGFALVNAGVGKVPNGQQFQQISYPMGGKPGGKVGIANFGTNCQLGMQIEAGKEYELKVFVRANASIRAPLLTASLVDASTSPATVLASKTTPVPFNGEWHLLTLNLSTSGASTTCGSFPASKLILPGLAQCFGSLELALSEPGDAVDVDYVSLLPGDWGLLPSATAGSMGLPANPGVPQWFAKEGIEVLRMGGSMCNADGYRWKQFRGPRELRQPYQGTWYRQSGLTQSRGFGMFEMADVCSAIGCEIIVTINNLELAGDMGDFVEYVWGDATTHWGQQRIEDGHPMPFNISWIEIGNEQGLDNTLLSTFTAITAAMDARSEQIGAPKFRYCIGHNLIMPELSGSDLAMVKKFLDAAAPYGDRVFWDFHVGAEPDSVAGWEVFFGAFTALVEAVGSKVRWVVLEENGSDHGLLRALGHAAYGNAYIRANGSLGMVHGFADAVEGWQAMDEEQAFPQGAVFYTPNATWGQPPFYAIQMEHEHAQPFAIAIDGQGIQFRDQGIDIAATTDPASSTVHLRVVNSASDTIDILPTFHQWTPASTVQSTTLAGNAPYQDNPLWNTTAIAPQTNTIHYSANASIALPPLSYTILAFQRNQQTKQ